MQSRVNAEDTLTIMANLSNWIMPVTMLKAAVDTECVLTDEVEFKHALWSLRDHFDIIFTFTADSGTYRLGQTAVPTLSQWARTHSASTPILCIPVPRRFDQHGPILG